MKSLFRLYNSFITIWQFVFSPEGVLFDADVNNFDNQWEREWFIAEEEMEKRERDGWYKN